jgi:hypothetical protein
MANLERVQLDSFYFWDNFGFTGRHNIILPESVWWLYLKISIFIIDSFWGFDQFAARIKHHVRYLKLATDFNQIHLKSLLSNNSSIKVLHVSEVDPGETGPSGLDTEDVLEILLLEFAYRVCYPDLKVNTVIVEHLITTIEEFFTSARYNGITTLYIGDVNQDNYQFGDILNIHALLPETKVFPSLSRLIIAWCKYIKHKVDDDDQPLPLPTYHTVTDRWIPQLIIQANQFNHFPALKTIEVVLPLPGEHRVTGLPIEHKFGPNNSRTIIIYDEDTKPSNAFDIEKEVQKALL